MCGLALSGELIIVSIGSPVTKCRLFQTNPELLGKLSRVKFGVSSDSLRIFVGAVPKIGDAKVRNLSQLCDEFKFIKCAKTVGDWQAEHPLTAPGILHEMIWRQLRGRRDLNGKPMLRFDPALPQRQDPVMSDVEKPAATKVEVSRRRLLLAETMGSGQKAVRDIYMVRTAAEQRLVCGCDICGVQEEMGRRGEVMADIWRSQGQQEGEASGLKEVIENLECKHEKPRQIFARQGDELSETLRQNEDLGSRVEQLEEVNRRLGDSSEGLKG
jgi:hypothetical protein